MDGRLAVGRERSTSSSDTAIHSCRHGRVISPPAGRLRTPDRVPWGGLHTLGERDAQPATATADIADRRGHIPAGGRVPTGVGGRSCGFPPRTFGRGPLGRADTMRSLTSLAAPFDGAPAARGATLVPVPQRAPLHPLGQNLAPAPEYMPRRRLQRHRRHPGKDYTGPRGAVSLSMTHAATSRVTPTVPPQPDQTQARAARCLRSASHRSLSGAERGSLVVRNGQDPPRPGYHNEPFSPTAFRAHTRRWRGRAPQSATEGIGTLGSRFRL